MSNLLLAGLDDSEAEAVALVLVTNKPLQQFFFFYFILTFHFFFTVLSRFPGSFSFFRFFVSKGEVAKVNFKRALY